MKNDYLPRLEPSSNQCRLQLLEPFPCTWLPFLPSLLRIIALKYLSVHLRFEYASPLYFLTKEQLLSRDESLRDFTWWNLLLAGEHGLFNTVISLTVLDIGSNQRRQQAQTIILRRYYTYSQLRNIGCYPLRKCDTQ